MTEEKYRKIWVIGFVGIMAAAYFMGRNNRSVNDPILVSIMVVTSLILAVLRFRLDYQKRRKDERKEIGPKLKTISYPPFRVRSVVDEVEDGVLFYATVMLTRKGIPYVMLSSDVLERENITAWPLIKRGSYCVTSATREIIPEQYSHVYDEVPSSGLQIYASDEAGVESHD